MKCARRKETGAALVEFALILPLLLLLLFGIVEFSIALYDKAVLTNASREAARAGVVYKVPQPTVAQIQAVATNYVQNHLITFGTGSSVSVNVSQPSGTTSGSPLTVTVSYTYAGLTLGKSFNPIPKALQLSATTSMNYE
ncbi:pilus assembly protein TadE [Burkholderia ubonensis]|uniref:Pilus assembly protein TadE n=1 Tax=Burkholderia ubonensis TaxID=101571 RepID=A0AAW3ND76_9BURK|nr:pilus assembly protein TadE [Burkholderia ubonensis]OJA54246.1 pilus assembly protein TadE [Burkholderia ubonensis]